MTRDVDDLDVEASVRAIYDAQFGRLVGWTTTLVGDPDLAHDFATEAFVKLLRHWSSVREPRAWLYVAVANLVRDHWRKRGREAMAYERHQAGVPEHAALSAGDLATTLTVREASAGAAGPAANAGAAALLCRSFGDSGRQPSRQVRGHDQTRPV